MDKVQITSVLLGAQSRDLYENELEILEQRSQLGVLCGGW
jgi:hypothetical protein